MSGPELFPVVIGAYEEHPGLDVEPELAVVAELFAEFGAEPVPWAMPMEDRGGDAVNRRLRKWSRPDVPADSVLYWLGHGWSDGLDVSLAHAVSPAAVRQSGVTPAQLAEAVRARHATADDQWTMVVVDTCWSSRFVDRLNAELASGVLGADRVLLIGVSGDGSTALGRFSAALRRCLAENFRTDERIELWRLAAELDRRLPTGLVVGRRLGDTALVRRVPPVAAAVSLPLDLLRELETALAAGERSHFVDKARSAQEGELAWFFEGRAAERAQIVRWLRTASSGLLVVTGPAGSGKSALLGHLLVHSLPDLRSLLVRARLVDALADDQQPADGVFDAAVHLTGMTLDALVRRIATVAGYDAGDETAADALDGLVAHLRRRERPLTLLVDALDEAVEPLAVARTVLRRIAGVPGVRLVVGTRASTHEGLAQPEPDDEDLLDALTAAAPAGFARTVWLEQDPDAVRRYVTRRLSLARERGALTIDGQAPGPEQVERTAELLGRRRGQFLYAQLAVHEILAEPRLLASAETLPGDHRGLFGHAVDRLARRSAAFPTLMEALALGRGRGVPIAGGVWAAMASALAGRPVADADVSAFLEAARPYVVVDQEGGQTVYRLAHRAFAERFLGGTPSRQPLLARALIALTGDGNPYVARHLSGHVADAGLWQELADAPSVLDRLDPHAVTADLLRTAFGGAGMPAPLAGVVHARHRLAAAALPDRAGIRHVACARLGGRAFTETPAPARPWTLRAAHLERVALHVVLSGHAGYVSGLAFLDDPRIGPVLASAGDDGTIRLWSPATALPVGAPLAGHRGAVAAVCPVPGPGGRNLLASAGADGTVRLWDPATALPAGPPLHGHTGAVSAVSAVPMDDGRTIVASGGGDGTVRLWDVDASAPLGPPLTGHDGPVVAVCVVPGALVASAFGSVTSGGGSVASADGSVTSGGGSVTSGGGSVTSGGGSVTSGGGSVTSGGGSVTSGGGSVTSGGGSVTSGGGSVTSGGGSVASASGSVASASGSVTPGGGLVASAGGSVTSAEGSDASAGGSVTAAAGGSVASAGGLVASAGVDGTVRLWDPATGAAVGPPLRGHTGVVSAVRAVPGPGRTLLASAGDDRTIRLWDPATGAAAGPPLTGHTAGVAQVTVVPGLRGRDLLASVGADGTVRLWDTVAGAAVGTPLGSMAGALWAAAAVLSGTGEPLLASAGEDGTVRLWDLSAAFDTARPPAAMPGLVCAVSTAHRTGGGTDLVSVTMDGQARRWDAATLLPTGARTTLEPGLVVMARVVTAGGSALLASAEHDGTVRRWHAGTFEPYGAPLRGHEGPALALATVPGPDGTDLLVSGGGDGTVRLWDPASDGPAVAVLTGHRSAIRCLSAVEGADGRPLLASGDMDGAVRLWDPRAGAAVGAPLTGHDGPVLAMASPRPGVLAVGRVDGSIACWDVAAGAPAGPPLRAHPSFIRAMCAVPPWLASAGADGRIRLSDHTLSGAGADLPGHGMTVRDLWPVPGPDGRPLLASGGHDGMLRLWDPRGRTPVGPPVGGRPGSVDAVATVTGPAGTPLRVLVGEAGTVHLWDPALHRRTALDLGRMVTAVAAGPPGSALAVFGAVDGWAAVVDVVTGEVAGVPCLTGDAPVVAVCRLAAGLLAAGTADGRLSIWDTRSGTAVHRADPLHDAPIRAVCTTPATTSQDDTDRNDTAPNSPPTTTDRNDTAPDGPPITTDRDDTAPDGPPITADRDDTAPDGPPATADRDGATRTAPDGPPTTTGQDGAAGTAPGGLLVTAGQDGVVRTVDAATGTPVGAAMRGHEGWVWSVALSPDGTLAASAGADGTVRLWDLRSGHGTVLAGHGDQARAVRFLTGRALASGGHDGTVRIWDVATHRLHATLPVGVPVHALDHDGRTITAGTADGVMDLTVDGSLLPG